MRENNALQLIQEMAAKTQHLQVPIQELINKFRHVIVDFEKDCEPNSCKQSALYWRHVVHVDSLIRIRLFSEQNFNYLESMSVLSLTRYLFELMIWLKLIQKDSRYGLIYYDELLLKQLNYYKDLRQHLDCEIAFLKEIAVQESQLLQRRLDEAQSLADSELRIQAFRRLGGDVMSEIDASIARKFTIYGEQAQINGYDFQAHLIDTKVLPGIDNSIKTIENELSLFEGGLSAEIKKLNKPWRWDQKAKLVGMEGEYKFIYTYTSRLLHATPASLTTDKKNLEPDEMLLFLKYIYIRMLDIIEMSSAMLPLGE